LGKSAFLPITLSGKVKGQDGLRIPQTNRWGILESFFLSHQEGGVFEPGFLVYPYYRESPPHSNCKASAGWAQKWPI
jgi:hypothetical protein